MRNRLWMIVSVFMLGSALACSGTGAAEQPTPTLFVLPTLPPASAAPTQPQAETQPTAEPTQSLPSFPTPTPVVQPGAGTVDHVQIYLIALEDGGKTGDAVGCGDSVVPVERQIVPTQAPLRAAMEELLSIKDQFFGESGLYNALYNSNLSVGSVLIDASGTASIELTGTMALGGECDDPRFEAQLTYTATQFSTVKTVQITINGKALKDLLGGK